VNSEKSRRDGMIIENERKKQKNPEGMTGLYK